MKEREGLTDQEVADFMATPGLERGRYALVVSVRWRVVEGGAQLVPEAFGRVVEDATGEAVEA